MTNKELKGTLEKVDKITTDTLGLIYGSGTETTIDTFYTTTHRVPYWDVKPDTSSVIIKYIFNWEEGEVETFAGKLVRSGTTVWIGSGEGQLFKVREGVWIPVDWPKDIINMYIKPNK